MTTLVWGWLVVGLMLVGFEFIIPGAILGFVGLAAFVVAGILHLGWIDGFVNALIAWFITSIISILFLRTFALQFMQGDSKVQDINEDQDANGCIVKVIESIKPETKGRISFRDSTWSAQCLKETIEKGENAIIVGRKGNTWIVKKKS